MSIGDFFHKNWKLTGALIVVATGVLAALAFSLLGGAEATPVTAWPSIAMYGVIVLGVIAFSSFIAWYKSPRPSNKS